MSRKSTVKAVVTVESRSVTEEMDSIRNTIETGVVDVQTITTLKRLLAQKATSTASITISATTKTPASAGSRTKRSLKTSSRTESTSTATEPFPGTDLISGTKTIVMKSLHVLTIEVEKRTRKSEPNTPSTETSCPKPSASQGTRNIISCCKMALESLRQWQEHVDIGSSWVNKAYFGYIGKVIALEMPDTAIKELTTFKTEIERQLQFGSSTPKMSSSTTRRKLQTSTRQNLPSSSAVTFDPFPLMSIHVTHDIDDEEHILLVCAYFNHLLRAIGIKLRYEADEALVEALDAPGGPISWIHKLPPANSSQQIDSISRGLVKIAVNTKSAQIQLSIRILRHRLALSQPTVNVESIAKSTFQALRSYYAATKSDKDAYSICKEALSPVLDKLIATSDGAKIVNFMGVMARKAGLLGESMKWNDLGLRKCADSDKSANALFILRTSGIMFSLPKEELDAMTDEEVRERLKYAYNCLSRFEEFEFSDSEGLREEVDYLRRAMLSSRSEVLESKQSLQEARQSFPRKILQAVTTLTDLNPALIPKLVIPTRTLIFDILTTFRASFNPISPPSNYLVVMDLCQKAAFKIQDNQALQFTGNQLFNCGNALYKAGKRIDARRVLEKSLELDFSPIPGSTEDSEEDKKKILTARCRKLEMLGECCVKGEEKDAFALILEALNVHLDTISVETDACLLPLGQLMKKEEYLIRLVGVLTKFTRDQSDWSPGDVTSVPSDEFSIVLNDNVSPEVKAVVYEIQVYVLLGMTHEGRYTITRNICRKALEIYTEANCPLRRVRVLERLLYLAVVTGEDTEDLLALGSSAISSLTATKTFGKDEKLHSSRKLILARCLAWMGLLSDAKDNPRNEYLSQALAIWTRWSEKAVHDADDADKSEMTDVVKVLEIMTDFFEFKSLSLLRLQSLHLLLKLQLYLSASVDVVIPIYASLALQYVRLGYTGKAGTVFAQGLKQMKDLEPSTTTQLAWHLHYAEYYARISNVAKAKEHMGEAGELYAREFSSPKKRISSAERAERVLAVGRAGFVLSLIAFEENQLEKAIGRVDYAIRVLKTGITAVERSAKAKVVSQDYDPFSSERPPPIEKAEKTGIQFGSKLWGFKSAFFTALLQHGVLLTFRGSARDGEFWSRQAYEAAQSMNARNAILVAALHLGDLFTRMSSLTNAHQFLSEAAEMADAVDKTKESVLMELSFYGLHGRNDVWSDAFRSIVRAETKLKKLLEPTFVNSLEKGDGIDLVDRFANLRISLGSPARNLKKPSSKPSRRQQGKKSTVSAAASPVEYESVTFSRMQIVISENKAYSLAKQRRFEEGYLAMDGILSNERLRMETLSAQITKAKILLLEVHQLLDSDPLLCVLSESAISIPSVHGRPTKEITGSRTTRGKHTRTRSKKMSQSITRFQCLLIEARESIEAIFEQACNLCPSALVPIVGLLMGEARLLSSIASEPDSDQNILALKTIMLLDRSRSVMYQREQAALEYQAKQEYMSLREIQWPEQPVPNTSDEDLSEMLTSLSVSTQKRTSSLTAENILQGIPTGCTVVSVHLSESKEHFILSKVQAQGCVVVRLPLLKHPPEADEEPFTFENAHDELLEIIATNNETAQSAKDVPDRQAKEIWWNTRKELDARLALFLQNMESCWIGGFTGMFRCFFPNDDTFARFRLTFRQILIKYLPSRREGDTPLELDPRLLDLFLSLKSDKPEMDSDVADQVEDLVCFVLDNFKFHGEQIAIDEVDLDAMTIDIQEAIRCYHEAVAPRKQDHVILILDKSLHMFPWESLPCLRGRSVSRLPTLGSLMERIVDSPIDGASWPSVSANRGFFVLNPEGDLKHTQSQFESTLSKIDGWNGIVGRAPMDQEILSALRNNDVFLYFGHGSGEQYVKSAQIKRLPNSAVTMLFGCSSGKLREAGDFEPWGTPFTYLLGGSPAMLANLWDVTDRDIDRLSFGVFSRWGLCDERPKSRASEDGPFEPERGMGLNFGGGNSIGERKKQLQASMKGKKYLGGSGKKGVSLTEALAAAREDCTLKYLNGAAPVIYGVPVFLEENGS